MARHERLRLLKARAMKSKQVRDIEELEKYKILKRGVLSENDTQKVQILIDVLKKMQKEDLERTSFDRFCRDILKIKYERFNTLIKVPVYMNSEEQEKLNIYLNHLDI